MMGVTTIGTARSPKHGVEGPKWRFYRESFMHAASQLEVLAMPRAQADHLIAGQNQLRGPRGHCGPLRVLGNSHDVFLLADDHVEA